jgi:hypothetical protein
MRRRIVSRNLAIGLFATVSALLAGPLAPPAASQIAHAPIPSDMNCSGIVTTEAVPRDTILITAEESNFQITFQQGDNVYINKGSDQGVKVGDEFRVMRQATFAPSVKWFSWQNSLLHAMGMPWEDEGRLRVLVTHPKVSIAQIIQSCSWMQRGDIVIPFAERQTPTLKPDEKFDHFAPPSGKSTAMVVMGKSFTSLHGTNDIIYVNLGSAQGVKVGDYFRIFRYQDTHSQTVYETPRQAFDMYGFGSVPLQYSSKDIPRDVIGEGIVLRTSPNSSSVLITFSLRELYSGDYVEIE